MRASTRYLFVFGSMLLCSSLGNSLTADEPLRDPVPLADPVLPVVEPELPVVEPELPPAVDVTIEPTATEPAAEEPAIGEEPVVENERTIEVAPKIEEPAPAKEEPQLPIDGGELTSEIPEAQPTIEIITDRYPNGKPRIERAVTRDANRNYVNNGPWKWLNTAGNVVAEGYFENGQRNGEWRRWVWPKTTPTVAGRHFTGFKAPFLSTGIFMNNQLHGVWTIADAKGKRVLEMSIEYGVRQGTLTWWHPSGKPRLAITYVDGIPNGQTMEWDARGNIVKETIYDDGRRFVKLQSEYRKDSPKQLQNFIDGKLVTRTRDDWWNTKFAEYEMIGERVKHGEWKSWHANGNLQMQAEYQHGEPVGSIGYFYSTGQKQCEGQFLDGKKTGAWVWWHKNGIVATEGYYENDQPTGTWTTWNEDGKVASTVNRSKNTEVAAPKAQSLDTESTSRRTENSVELY